MINLCSLCFETVVKQRIEEKGQETIVKSNVYLCQEDRHSDGKHMDSRLGHSNSTSDTEPRPDCLDEVIDEVERCHPEYLTDDLHWCLSETYIYMISMASTPPREMILATLRKRVRLFIKEQAEFIGRQLHLRIVHPRHSPFQRIPDQDPGFSGHQVLTLSGLPEIVVSADETENRTSLVSDTGKNSRDIPKVLESRPSVPSQVTSNVRTNLTSDTTVDTSFTMMDTSPISLNGTSGNLCCEDMSEIYDLLSSRKKLVIVADDLEERRKEMSGYITSIIQDVEICCFASGEDVVHFLKVSFMLEFCVLRIDSLLTCCSRNV